MKFRRNQEIKFEYISDFTGLPLILTGTIKGFGEAVRKKWPIEMGEAPDDILLVFRKDVYGNSFYHAVSSEEVIEDPVAVLENQKED